MESVRKSPLATAIDMGSNAIRLRIGGLGALGKLNIVKEYRESVRLGHDAFTCGQLSEATIEQTVQAFYAFRAIMDQYPAHDVRATGTSALRSVRNADEVIQRVHKETGIQIETISGEEEARLIHTAIHHSLPDMHKHTAMLIDIGGGSVEITITVRGDMVAVESFKMGTVRLLELFRHAPDDIAFAKLLHEYIETMNRRIREEISKRKIDICIGTGGNIECMGALGVSLLNNKSQQTLDYKSIKRISRKLLSMDVNQRVEQLHLRPDRADVIVPAVFLLKSLMKLVRPAVLTIPCVSLGDGILLDMLHAEGRHDSAHQALAWARSLAQKFHADMDHAEHVCELAEMMFTQLSACYTMAARDVILLKVAALLHEIGMAVRPSGHHHHAYYLLHASPMIGLSIEEKKMVSIMVRYHRKRLPDRDHEPFSLLSEQQQERVLKLNVILRLAIALDKDRKGHVKKVMFIVRDDGLELDIQGKGSLLLERWAAYKQLKWFEKVFGHSLYIPIKVEKS